MSSDASPQHMRFLHTVASLYHLEGKTQVEIAQLLSVSRSRVLRALQEARALGIVQITVVDPSRTNTALASELEARLGLHKAIVVAGNKGDATFTRERVGHAAAAHLSETLPNDATVGLGWGRTLYSVTQALDATRSRTVKVIPLLGGLGKIAPSFQVHDMARVMSEKLGGSWTTLFVPALVDSPEAYASLLASTDVSEVTAAWRSLDVAVIGIGNIDLGEDVQMLFADYLDDVVVGELQQQGAVGDVCMRFFDAAGEPVEGSMPYLFSIELEQVRAVPRVIAVACGAAKARAILGAAAGGYFETLITDDAAAREIVRLHETAALTSTADGAAPASPRVTARSPRSKA